MVGITEGAAEQRDKFLQYYKKLKRWEAGRNFSKAIRDAVSIIQQNPTSGRTHPNPYPEVAAYGYLWIKIHIYWISWKVSDGMPIITNVLWDQADIPNVTITDDV
jgi:plasmid stabilization system protein ParE